MKRHLMLGSVFSAALAIGVSAQSTPPPSQSPTSQPPSSQSPTSQDTGRDRSAQTVTVTGCLKADSSSPSAAPGAPGAPAASAAAGGFILEASGSGAAAPGEKPSPTATSGSATTYKLSGGSGDLASLVGKKVEVKGTVQNRAGSAAGGAPESRPGAMGDTAKAQQLRVSSVKEVSGSCSQ